MWVKHLTLKNFRGFESLELELDRPLTVLVGANGSGKTSILKALVYLASFALLRPLRHADRELDFPGASDIRLGADRALLGIKAEQGGETAEWSFEPGRDQQFVDMPGPWVWETARSIPTVIYVPAVRTIASGDGLFVPVAPDNDSRGVLYRDWLSAPHEGFKSFFRWFKEREDVENERRIAARDFEVQDPQLRAVREAVAALMPGFDKLRIQRDPTPAMVVTKDGVELRLDQLSDGERNLIALAGDLARRMVIADPSSPRPRETEGVILIDEVEQHLHPAWQRRVIPALQRAFPKAQLIVTTHSPQVLSSVPASSIVLLDGHSARAATAPTEGRDTNAILREVFGLPERPQPQVDAVRELRALIDEERLDEARAKLDALAAALSEGDDEVVALRMRLHVAEAAA